MWGLSGGVSPPEACVHNREFRRRDHDVVSVGRSARLG
jgi:hypothetical protein